MEITNSHKRGKLGIISCVSGMHFADKVVQRLNEIVKEETNRTENVLIGSDEIVFADSEVKTEINESIRERDVYVFQDVQNRSKGLSVNDNFMALKTAIDAAKRAGAYSVTAVVPAFPYARQDKQKKREGITAAMAAREIEDCGATRVITLDIHNEAISGFFRHAVLENLRAIKDLTDYIKDNISVENLVVSSADVGGAARARDYAKRLGTKIVIINKDRDYSIANSVENMTVIGNVVGKNVFVIDDMIDTAGTLEKAALKLKEEGANKIYFGASLPIFSGPAINRIDGAYAKGLIDKVIGTNVIYRDVDFKKNHPWYDEVLLERYFGRVIYNHNQGRSIGKLLD